MRVCSKMAIAFALIAAIVVACLLAGCASAPAATPTSAPAAPTAAPAAPTSSPTAPTKAAAQPSGAGGLSIEGLVSKPVTLSVDDLKAKAEKITAEHPKKGKTEYTGIRLNKLFEMAQPKPEAKTFLLVCSDGYKAEVPLSALKDCTDCMLALGDDPIPDAVMPGMDMGVWARDVVKIEVK